VIPFVAAEFLRGDDDTTDRDLKGFVSPSSPNGLRPGDFPLSRKTVTVPDPPPAHYSVNVTQGSIHERQIYELRQVRGRLYYALLETRDEIVFDEALRLEAAELRAASVQ
jgi:hypothetical protein